MAPTDVWLQMILVSSYILALCPVPVFRLLLFTSHTKLVLVSGSANTACMVSIRKLKEEKQKEGEEPFFTKGLVDKWIDAGETLVLNCTVTGIPTPTIRW